MAYRFDLAVRCWLVGDDGPIPDRTPKTLDRVIPTFKRNPQAVADCSEDSCGGDNLLSRAFSFCLQVVMGRCQLVHYKPH